MVTEYLKAAGLLPYPEKLGFDVAAYGCTTCIGNAGDLTPEINEAIVKNDTVAAAVLSGNRNFEARIHPNIRANFLASPLVVAYAIAGTMTRDLMTEPVGRQGGRDIYRATSGRSEEIHALMKFAMNSDVFKKNYARQQAEQAVGGHHRHQRPCLRLADLHLHRRTALLPGLQHGAGPERQQRARRARWASSATRSPPTTSRRQARSRTPRRPASTCRNTAC